MSYAHLKAKEQVLHDEITDFIKKIFKMVALPAYGSARNRDDWIAGCSDFERRRLQCLETSFRRTVAAPGSHR